MRSRRGLIRSAISAVVVVVLGLVGVHAYNFAIRRPIVAAIVEVPPLPWRSRQAILRSFIPFADTRSLWAPRLTTGVRAIRVELESASCRK
jgi:hypothetical protein